MSIWRLLGCISVLGMVTALPARAAINEIRGTVQARLVEILNGSPGDSDDVSDSFPETSSTLPISVVADLASNSESGAGIAAAQLADPTTVLTSNPQEFALSLAISSVAEDRRYEATAGGSESRAIVFSPAEFPGRQNGDRVTVRGRIFVDGALALLAESKTQDLNGAFVRLHVSVSNSSDESSAFEGEIILTGAANGEATRQATGGLASFNNTFDDLAAINPEFGRFWVVALPSGFVDYSYQAVIGEEFTLTARFDLEAENLPDGVGCAAVIGRPFTTLTQVIGLTENSLAATAAARSIQDQQDLATALATPAGICPAMALGATSLAAIGLLGARRARRRT